jgi:hypothetical protein
MALSDAWLAIKPYPIPQKAFEAAQRHWRVKLTAADRRGVRDLFARCRFIEQQKATARQLSAGPLLREEKEQRRHHKRLAKLWQETADAQDAERLLGPPHSSLTHKLHLIAPGLKLPDSNMLRALAMLAVCPDFPTGRSGRAKSEGRRGLTGNS